MSTLGFGAALSAGQRRGEERGQQGRMRAGGEWFVQIIRENWLLLLVVGGIVVAFLALRTSPSEVRSVAEVDSLLRDGRPTLVEFYSNT